MEAPNSPEEMQDPLAKPEPQATEIEAYEDVADLNVEFEDLEQEDFKLPVVRIAQAQSRNAPAGSEGQYWNNVTGEVKPNPEVSIVRVAKTRILFPAEYQADADLLCASDDSKRPREEFVGKTVYDWPNRYPQYQIPSTCEACALKDWGPNNEVPPCSLSYKYVVVDLDTGMPGVLSLKRTDVPVARSLNTLLSTPGLKKLRLSSEFERSDKGQWHAFRYQLLGKLTQEEFETVAGMVQLTSRAVVSADIDADDMDGSAEPSDPGYQDYDPNEFGSQEEDDIPF